MKERPVEIWEEDNTIQAFQMNLVISGDEMIEERPRKEHSVMLPYEDALLILAIARDCGAQVNTKCIEKLYGQFKHG